MTEEALRRRKAGPDESVRQPAYWFVLLEMARERRDFAEAARCRAELLKLGVIVKYVRPAGEAK